MSVMTTPCRKASATGAVNDKGGRSGIVLIGCGAQAKYCREIFTLTDREIIAVWDPIGEKVGAGFYGIEVEAYNPAGFSELKAHSRVSYMVCASGPALKKKIHQSLEKEGLSRATAIHPNSCLAGSARVGKGSIVNPGAVVQPEAVIGKGCMIHSNVVVEHDCRVGDYANLAMGVILAGRVDIGEGATLYSGSVVGPNLKIGAGAIVGAGSLVLDDIPPGVLAYGRPAGVVRGLGEKK